MKQAGITGAKRARLAPLGEVKAHRKYTRQDITPAEVEAQTAAVIASAPMSMASGLVRWLRSK